MQTTAGQISYVTVATRDFLPAVCVLATSLRRHDPDAGLSCYLVGDGLSAQESAALPFHVRRTDTLPIADARRFFFEHTTKELCCALKPHIMADALRRGETAAVVYLDADINVYAPIAAVFAAYLAVGGSVALTPHLLTTKLPSHVLIIMRAGIYNGGVIAVRNDGDGMAFLEWWQQCVATSCVRDPCGGVSADQRWLDLAVALFPFVRVIRDPGLNVGYWNLHERLLSAPGGEVMVNGKHVLRIYHFSNVTRTGLTEFAAGTIGPGDREVAATLAREYHAAIVAFSAVCPGAAGDPWSHFTDGTPIRAEHREVVRRRRVAVNDPFQERHQVEGATPGDAVEVFGLRATFWVESGPGLLADARAGNRRLRRHPGGMAAALCRMGARAARVIGTLLRADKT